MASFSRPRVGHLQRKPSNDDRKADHLKELEQGFNMHFVSTSKPQPKRNNSKQPSWLAEKIRRQCVAEAEGETTEPLWKLLDREVPSETKTSNYSPKLGEEVEVKDKDMPEWRVGVVTATVPLKVRLLDWEEEFQWDHVRRWVKEPTSKQAEKKIASPPRPEKCTPSTAQTPVEEAPTAPFAGIRPEQTCTCGNRFQKEALFCCRCGRQRGCEPAVPPNLGKPPRPPAQPAPPPRPKNIEASGIKKSGMSPRMRFAVPTNPNPVGGLQEAFSRMDVEKTAKLPCICHACGGNHPSQDCPGVFTFHMEVCGESLKTSLPSRPGSASSLQIDKATVAALHSDKVPHSDKAKPLHARDLHAPKHSEKVAVPRSPSPWNSSMQRRTLTKQHWQQLTVPILAADGEVIDLKPADEANQVQGVWQQHTVPILGDNGEVIALRAAPGDGPVHEWKLSTLPIFDEQGELIAVQNRGENKWLQSQRDNKWLANNADNKWLPAGADNKWQQETVPVLGENGEVIALRPAATGACMWTQKSVPIFGATGQVVAVCPAIGNLQKWEQCTVPLLGENGDVVALRPAGNRYEMPGWKGPEPSQAPQAKLRSGMANAGSSMRSDITHVPGKPLPSKARNSDDHEQVENRTPNQDSPPLSEILWAERGRRGRRGSESDVDSLKMKSISSTIKSPEAVRKGRRGSSESALKMDSLKVESISNTMNSLEKAHASGRAVEPEFSMDSLKMESVSIPVSGATSLNVSPAPSPDIRDVYRRQANPAEAPPMPDKPNAKRRPMCKELSLSPSPSVASMASLDEILRMCNEARQATPQGQMLEVLRDALGPQNSTAGPGGGESISKLGQLAAMPQAPEADELVARLKQLPDLWRTTILSMLEQAEACQLPRTPSPGE